MLADGTYGGIQLLAGHTSRDACAIAVRAYNGQDGCIGNYFFFEFSISGQADNQFGGYCNCPRDQCTLGFNGTAGQLPGQLYRFADSPVLPTEPIPEPGAYSPVNNRGCESFIHMDSGTYGGVPLSAPVTLHQCATAVAAYNGLDGCNGSFFFFEDAGFCNCPTDECTLPRDNWLAAGSAGQLCALRAFKLGTRAQQLLLPWRPHVADVVCPVLRLCRPVRGCSCAPHQQWVRRQQPTGAVQPPVQRLLRLLLIRPLQPGDPRRL